MNVGDGDPFYLPMLTPEPATMVANILNYTALIHESGKLTIEDDCYDRVKTFLLKSGLVVGSCQHILPRAYLGIQCPICLARASEMNTKLNEIDSLHALANVMQNSLDTIFEMFPFMIINAQNRADRLNYAVDRITFLEQSHIAQTTEIAELKKSVQKAWAMVSKLEGS